MSTNTRTDPGKTAEPATPEEDGNQVEIEPEDSPFDLEAEQYHLDQRFPMQQEAEPEHRLPPVELEDDDEEEPGEPAAHAKPDEDGEGDDDAEYSARVQKRINKEIRRRKTAEAAKAAAEAARQQAEMQAAHAIQYAQQLAGQTVDSTVDAMEAEYASTRDKLTHAIEQGDTENQVALTDRMADLRANIALAKQHQRPRRPEGQQGQQPQQPQQQQYYQQPQQQQVNPMGQQFAQRHGAWWNNPEYAAVQAYAMGLDVDMTRRGVPLNQAYYDTLETEIFKHFPEVRDLVDGEDDDAPAAPQPRRRQTTPVAPAGRGSPTRGSTTRGKTKVSLTKTDLETMEAFGLDPSDPTHVAEFARNKIEAGA